MRLVPCWSAPTGTQNHRREEREPQCKCEKDGHPCSHGSWYQIRVLRGATVRSSESHKSKALKTVSFQIVRPFVDPLSLTSQRHWIHSFCIYFYRLPYPASFFWFYYFQSIWGSLAPQAGSSTCFSVLCKSHENGKEGVGWRGEVFNLKLLFSSNVARLIQMLPFSYRVLAGLWSQVNSKQLLKDPLVKKAPQKDQAISL